MRNQLKVLLIPLLMLATTVHADEDDNPCPPTAKPGPCYYWEGKPTCSWLPKDPGEQPEGCYELDDNCEWAAYTPDCSAEEEAVAALQVKLARLAARIAMVTLKRNKMERWCACEQNPLMCLFVPVDSAPPPNDPCGEVDRLNALLAQLEKEVEETTKALVAALAALEDCKNCR